MVITCLLVVLQLAFLIVEILKLQNLYIYISAFLSILSLCVVAYIVSKDMKPSAKLAWIVPILLFPVLGGLMYVLYGHIFIPKKLYKNMLRVKEQEINDDLWHGTDVPVDTLKAEPPYRLFKYVEIQGEEHLFQNTDVKYYAMCDEAFPDMLEDLKKAEKYIFLEYFIINHGFMWDSILEILKEKVAQGVEVRVMYDDIGSVFYVPKYYWKELEKMGIKCISFNQVIPFLATIFNNRDHRKIAVIDGRVAYTGGYNLADEYINEVNLYGKWKDTGVRMEGDAAWRFTVMFLQMWNSVRIDDGNYDRFVPERKLPLTEDGYLMPYRTNPLSKEALGENIYLQMINDARDYIYIFSPYLIVGNELMTAMKLAAKRGVDVRIVTPAIPDKKFIYRMTQSSYKELILSGVKIYQYTPGFIHAKCVLADDKLASIGSVNMDNRSFYHHFECGTLIYNSTAIKDIKADMVNTIEESERITLEWCKENLSRFNIIDAILKLLSPLL